MTFAIPDGMGIVGTSLWSAVNPPPAPAIPLRGRASTDVLIIGGGIAGLSLGLHLGAKKIDAVILEAGDDAVAATGASAGIVAPQLVRTTPRAVLERLGPEIGARLLTLIAESGRYTFELVDRLNIECDAKQSGFLSPAAGLQGASRQAQLIEEWRPFRDDLRHVDAAEVQTLSGCQGYSSAIADPTGGCLDPIAYSRGMAQALRAGGMPLHHGSRVLSLMRSQEGWTARTQSGEVAARRVVLCANGGNSSLHPALARTVLPLPVCEVATVPLAPSMRERILRHGHALTDTSAPVFSIRFDAAGRLITACPARKSIDSTRIETLINRRLAAMIPGYRGTPLEYIWQGTAWLNSTLLPRVLRVEGGLFAVQACNGRGIALNTIIGRELGRWLADPNDGPLLVPLERPQRIAAFMFARHLPNVMMSGATLAKRALACFGRR
jgi:glycine/D-amino acid oxidase-like deaminating enzyme